MKRDGELAVILPAADPHLTPRAAGELLAILLDALHDIEQPLADAA